MATAQAHQDEKLPAGMCRLTEEEIEDLEQADVEADEDRRLGQLRPIGELLAKLALTDR